MKYRNDENVEIGDMVRIVISCYPNPKPVFLGKVGVIVDIYEEVNCVKLDRWSLNINAHFLEKIYDVNYKDITTEINESNIFQIK